MKTAIILTGGMRSFDKTLPNLAWQVLRHFPKARYYIATEDDGDAHKADLIGTKTQDAVIYRVKQPEMIIPDGCPTTWTQGRPYMHEPYSISVPPAAVMGQLWMLREGWKLYLDANDPADLIIRLRPDLWFHSFEVPRILRPHSMSTPPFMDMESVAFTPWFGRFGGINDRFALLGPEAAAQYFTTYEKIPMLLKAGCPLHPESLIDASLRIGAIHIEDNLKAEFSTLRTSGEMRPPEISAIDIAHAAMNGCR